MTTVFLSPVYGAGVQLLNNSGVPLANGKVYVYQAGTTSPKPTYTTNQATVANPNPIVLDASGRMPTMMWLPSGISYKFVVTDSLGSSVGYTLDGITGVNDATFPYNVTQEWNLGSTPTYLSATSFSVVGDQTTTYTAGRRVQTINTGGIAYSTITGSSYTGGVTQIIVYNDSTPLDAGLNALYFGFLSASPSSMPGTVAVMNYAAAVSNSVGLGNGAIGPLAVGPNNVALGYQAYHAATTGTNNIAIGAQSMGNGVTTGSNNIGIGPLSLTSLTSGISNVGIGLDALQANTTGSNNVAVGRYALFTVLGNGNNVAVGDSALLSSYGAQNTAVGSNAGSNASASPMSGTNNVYLGYLAVNLTVADSNSVTIGANATSKGSNTVYIGNASMTDTYLTGRINIPQYTTAGAPAYVKGALYFDTTLNKLRVGGASAWETITSV